MLDYLMNVPSVQLFLQEFAAILQVPADEALSENEDYMHFMELYFLLKNLRELTDINIYQASYKPDTLSREENNGNVDVKRSHLDTKSQLHQLALFDRGLKELKSYLESRLAVADLLSKPIPRIVHLAREYGFSSRECDLFNLMVVAQGSNNAHVLNSLTEEDYMRKMTAFQRLSGVSEVDVDIFCDGERPHMKENLVTTDEENGMQFNLRVQKVAVQLLYGRKVKSDDLLKISQTSLEEIIIREQILLNPDRARGLMEEYQQQAKRKRESINPGEDNEEVDEDLMDGEYEESEADFEGLDCSPSSAISRQNSLGNESAVSSSSKKRKVTSSLKPIKLMRSNSFGPASNSARKPHTPSSMKHVHLQEARKKLDNVLGKDDAESNEAQNEVKSAGLGPGHHSLSSNDLVADPGAESLLKPYDTSNQLEYLEDSFQLIALMIKGNVARMKDDLKKEGTSRYNNSWGEPAGDMKHSKRELTAKLKLQEHRIQIRLQKTIDCGLSLPRLEVLMQRFQMDTFEKRIILLLIGKTVSPIVRTLLDTLDTSNRVAEDVITVGQSLAILCQDFNLQIAHRKYFYQSSRLMKNAVISLHKTRWHVGSGDLTENRVMLDRRILDWVVGLDSEINELVEGSDLYVPQVNLSQVVLPTGYSERILSQCSSYDDFQQYRIRVGLAKQLTYGNSLVILLWGKSGTGKTMTVNAVAHELGKKVLLVDFNSLLNKKDSSGGGEFEVDLKGLFRESKMNNAVLFFDECETIFKTRNHGSDRILNSLLTEIERYDGIVFMATNRPYEIDEAMHRRITMVLEYREPDSNMRKLIWDHLLGISSSTCRVLEKAESNDEQNTNVESDKGLVLSNDVNTSMLSSKYELTGGFIKNAVLSAMLSALSRDRLHPVITQKDLLEGCKMQMRGNLTQRAFEDKIPRKRLLTSLFVQESDRNVLKKIIRYEQTRSQVYGSWGIATESQTDKKSCNETACINLLAGNRGSGKSTLVETVAYELGEKRIKKLHVADFTNQSLFEVTEVFKALVKDASILDAIIVVDGFEHVLDDPSAADQNNSKIHLLLSRIMDILYEFHGCVFLLAHIENPQNIVLQRDFGSRLYAFMRIVLPQADVRQSLWKSLIPVNAPVVPELDFVTLGRKFELYPGSIQSAIAHAAAEAASRPLDKQKITMKDLLASGEYEIAKLKSGNHDMISKLFT